MAAASGSSAEPHRTSAYSSYLQWHMVYQKKLLGLTCREVGENLNVDASTVSRVASRFYQRGDVDEHPKSGRPTALTAYDEFVILLTRPSTYLRERVDDMKPVTGTEVDEATVCRFLKKEQLLKGKTATSSTTAKCRATIQVHIRLLCLLLRNVTISWWNWMW